MVTWGCGAQFTTKLSVKYENIYLKLILLFEEAVQMLTV